MIWLLSLTYAGQTLRWSTSPVSVPSGSTWLFHFGGLVVEDLEEAIDLLGVSIEPRTVPLSLIWPSPGVAQYISAGYPLTTARAELSRWDGSSDWSTREIVIKGRLTEPQYGSLQEPVVASLEELPYNDTNQIPDVDAVITTETWPNAVDGAIGRAYPLIAGLPGHITGSTDIERDVPGSIAPTVDTDLILIAGHGVTATSVSVTDSAGATATVAVTEQADGIGRTCSVCDISLSGLTLGEDEYGICWPTAGGRTMPGGTDTQFAGDVLCWLLGLSRIRVDWPQVRALSSVLDWLVVVVDIEAQGTSWAWLTDHLLPVLPVSAIPGGGGLRIVPWKWDAKASEAVAVIVAGPGVVRNGPVTYEGDVVNSCTVKYAYNAVSGGCVEYVTVCGYPDPDDVRQFESQGAKASQDSLRDDELGDDGIRSETIEAECVCSERAAHQIALWRVEALSERRRTVAYDLVDDPGLELGSVVLFQDEELYIPLVIALVDRKSVV